jgi:hypothetical protein
MAMIDPKSVEKIHADGFRLVSVGFAISLFFDRPFAEIRQQVLACIELMQSQIPKDALRWYATETMAKHRAVTKRVLSMLPTWLAPSAPTREYIALELKDGVRAEDAPHHMLQVFSEEFPDPEEGPINARILRLFLPHEAGQDRSAEMAQFVVRLCQTAPCRHALAGYALMCSRYSDYESQTQAVAFGMRHPGVDILVDIADASLVGSDSIKGVSWLTMIDMRFVDRLGGIGAVRSSLTDGVELIELDDGVILRAGVGPKIGDTNRRDTLPEYRTVFAVVRPLLEPAIARKPGFALADADAEERALAWFLRLGDR